MGKLVRTGAGLERMGGVNRSNSLCKSGKIRNSEGMENQALRGKPTQMEEGSPTWPNQSCIQNRSG